MMNNEQLYDAFIGLHLHYTEVAGNYLKMAKAALNNTGVIIPEEFRVHDPMAKERAVSQAISKEQRDREILDIMKRTHGEDYVPPSVEMANRIINSMPKTPFQLVTPTELRRETDAAIKKLVDNEKIKSYSQNPVIPGSGNLDNDGQAFTKLKHKGRKPGSKNKPKGKVPIEAIEKEIAIAQAPKKRGRKPGSKDAVPRKTVGRPAKQNQEALTPFQQAKKQFEEDHGRKPDTEELLTIANRFAKP